MKLWLCCFVFVGYLLAAAAAAPVRVEKLLFEDNFDTINFSRWKHDLTFGGGGNWEFQWYTNNRRNTFVANSTLFIKPSFTAEFLGSEEALRTGRHEIWGSSPANQCTGNAWWGCERTVDANNLLNPIMSGRLSSVDSFNFRYGRIEFRAKVPRADWVWPAVWLLPKWNEYGEWPRSGEIDILEARGNDATCIGPDGTPLGNNAVSSAAHWGPDWDQNAYPLTVGVRSLPPPLSYHDSFHVYGLAWDEEGLRFYVDNESNSILNIDRTDFWEWGSEEGYWSATDFNPWQHADSDHAPFDKPFYIVMNLAVGGTTGFFPDGVCNKPWTNTQMNAQGSFYSAKPSWINSWQDDSSGYDAYAVSDNAALQIDWLRVYSFDD